MGMQLDRRIESLTRLAGGTKVAELALNVVMSLDLASLFVLFDVCHTTPFKAHASDTNVSSAQVHFTQIMTVTASNKNR